MLMLEKYNEIKEKNENSVVIIKSGIFYNMYKEDAIIISYLMNYKLFYNNNNICVSFTDKSLSLVLSRLRIRKISYIVINKEITEQFIGGIMEYNRLLKEANLVCEKELLIDKINEGIKKMNIDSLKAIYELLERK